MDWFHCNACFIQPEDGDTTKGRFYFTSCGHMFCENCGCFVEGSSDCCKSCRNKCSYTLTEKKSFRTNPILLKYFQDPEKACEQLFSIIHFQTEHRNKLFLYNQNMLSKYKKAKSYIKKLKNELKITKNALRNKPQKSCSFNENIATSTPIFQPHLSPFKMIDSDASQYTPILKQKTPDRRNRKNVIQNELSMLFKDSIESENQSIKNSSSSVNASPLQDLSDENIANQFLNSFEKRQFTRYNRDI